MMGMLRRIKNRERRIEKAKNIKLYNTPKQNSLRSRLKRMQAAEVKARLEAVELAEAKESAKESMDVDLMVDAGSHVPTGFGSESLIIESIPVDDEISAKVSDETVDNDNRGENDDPQTVNENEGTDVEADRATPEDSD